MDYENDPFLALSTEYRALRTEYEDLTAAHEALRTKYEALLAQYSKLLDRYSEVRFAQESQAGKLEDALIRYARVQKEVQELSAENEALRGQALNLSEKRLTPADIADWLRSGKRLFLMELQ